MNECKFPPLGGLGGRIQRGSIIRRKRRKKRTIGVDRGKGGYSIGIIFECKFPPLGGLGGRIQRGSIIRRKKRKKRTIGVDREKGGYSIGYSVYDRSGHILIDSIVGQRRYRRELMLYRVGYRVYIVPPRGVRGDNGEDNCKMKRKNKEEL